MKAFYKIFDNIYFGIFLLLAVTAFIFSHSVVSADVSSGQSSTVVDVVTSKEEQEICRRICESVGATLRIRPYIES